MGELSATGRYVSLFGLLFLLLGFIYSSSPMYMIGFFCICALLGAALVAWIAGRGVRCRREMPGSAIFAGDPLEGRIMVTEARRRWRMLEILDQHVNQVTGRVTRRRMSLLTESGDSRAVAISGARQTARILPGGGREVEVRDMMRFARRGHYRLGPLTVQSHDPFGLLSVARVVPVVHDVIVYPRPLPMTQMVLGGQGGRQTTEVRPVGRAGESADFHGIRPYVQGDDLRRVHWKATAHTGKLAIKEYEYRYSGAVQVTLDLQHGIHVGEGEFSTLEAAVTLAASILNYVVKAGNQAGLFTTGRQVVNLPQESGQRQLLRALEALALARDDGEVPLAQALASGEAQLSRHCTTIVITPTVDLSIISPLLALRGRSAQALLVLLDPRSFHEAQRRQQPPRPPLAGWARKTLRLDELGKALGSWTTAPPQVPTEDEHRALLNAAAAAGLEVFPVGAGISLNQALHGIHVRVM